MLSHLVYGHADDDPQDPKMVDGWIIWIYYPHNYVKDDDNDGVEDNPRGLGMGPIDPQTGPASVDDPITEERDDYGFTFSIDTGEIQSFNQGSGPCTDERIGLSPPLDTEDTRELGQDYRDDFNNVPCRADGSDFSVQFFVKTSAEKLTVTIVWKDGMYSGQTQKFNIMKEISMKNWDEAGYDPDHNNQHRWD